LGCEVPMTTRLTEIEERFKQLERSISWDLAAISVKCHDMSKSDISYLLGEVKRLSGALESIRNSPGGGPGRRIASQALEEGK